jgi:hypothetical protein
MNIEIPARILADRGALSIHQALCAYLCDDPEGPQLSHAQAARAIGLAARQEVATHLKRAREEADDFGWLPWYIDRPRDPTGPQRAR